ncbi:MAG: hypothetical protein QM504_13350 [Pseudomonadota bacterium]
MCSTPRSSGSAKKIHRLPTSKAHFESYSQMMHRASKVYEQRQEERARRREKLAQEKEKNESSTPIQTPVYIDSSNNESDFVIVKTLKERINQFIVFMKTKIPPIEMH